MDGEELRRRLDTTSWAYVEQLQLAGSDDPRAYDEALARVRGQGQNATAPECAEEVTIPPEPHSPTSSHPLRAYLYSPMHGGRDAGLLLYFHAGGFVLGSAAAADPMCQQFSRRAGCYVLAVDYRLAPEWPFPAAVDDCQRALRWAYQEAGPWRRDRLAVGGSSAGGNLAAVTALLSRASGPPHVCFQMLLCPLLDFRPGRHRSRRLLAMNPVLSAPSLSWFERRYLRSPRERDDMRASPLAATDLTGMPESLIVAGHGDPLHDEAEAYAQALSRAGNCVHFGRYPSVHAFVSMFDVLPAGQRALTQCVAALRRAIGSPSPPSASRQGPLERRPVCLITDQDH